MPILELEDGYYTLPPGKLASVVTVLEMPASPQRALAPWPRGWRLEVMHSATDLRRYRALYSAVGERWMWFSRRVMTDAELLAILEHEDTLCLALTAGDGDAGILELDFRDTASCELAFFGLTGEHQGRGLGRALMDEGIRRAFARPLDRFWVHTCTHDAPGAVAFYERSGFIPVARQIEIHDDYRLRGLLPHSAGPHVPLLKT